MPGLLTCSQVSIAMAANRSQSTLDTRTSVCSQIRNLVLIQYSVMSF